MDPYDLSELGKDFGLVVHNLTIKDKTHNWTIEVSVTHYKFSVD